MIVDFQEAARKRDTAKIIDATLVITDAVGRSLVRHDPHMTKHEAAEYFDLFANAAKVLAEEYRNGPDGPMGA